MTGSDRSRGTITAAIVVALATVACYAVTFQAGFVYDDADLITQNPLVVAEGVSIGDVLGTEFFGGGGGSSGFYRPLMVLIYRTGYALFPGDPEETGSPEPDPLLFHVVVVLTHAAAAVVLLLVIVRCGVSVLAAAGGALFFALHPANTESVAWISGGANPTVFFFMGLALLFLLRFRESKGRMWRSVPLWLSYTAFVLALGAKETALLFPFIAFVLLAMPARDGWEEGGRKLHAFIPIAVLSIAYVVVHGQVAAAGEGSAELFHGRGDLLERALTFLSVVPDYALLLFWPADLNIARPVTLASTIWNVKILAGAAILFAAAAIAFRSWFFGRKAALLGAALFLLGLLSVSTLIPFAYGFTEMDFPFFERHLYVPAAGMACLLATAAGRLLGRLEKSRAARPALIAAGSVLLALAGAAAHGRSRDWRDDLTLFGAAAAAYPDSAVLQLNLGEAHYGAGWRLRGEAIGLMERGDETGGKALLDEAGAEFERALEAFRRAAAVDPDLPAARVNEAIALCELGRESECTAVLRQVLERWPENCQALDAMGTVLGGRGQIELALPFFARAVRLSNGDPAFRANLAFNLRELRLHTEKLYLDGKTDSVMRLAGMVLAEAPDTAWAYEVRGLILEDGGNPSEAIRAYLSAVRLSRDSLVAASRLVGLFRERNMEAEALQMELYLEEGRKRLPPDLPLDE